MRITWEQVTDSSIGISWEPVQKADCYRVYWADSAGSTVRYLSLIHIYNGMYRLDSVRNKTQMEEYLDEIRDNYSSLFWSNNIEKPSPYSNGVYQSNTLDLSGFFLVMKLPGSIQRMDQAVLVGLNLTKLQQQLDKNLAGYELCVLDYDGTPLFASDERCV